MPPPAAYGFLFDVVLLLNRLTLGGYFLLAGLGKLIYEGWGRWYETKFVGLAPPWLPNWFAYPYGHAIPMLEIAVGAMLLLGFLTRLTSLVMLLMLASFTIALLVKLGPSGGGPVPGLHYNWILLTLALVFFVVGPGRFSADAVLRRRGVRRPESPVRG